MLGAVLAKRLVPGAFAAIERRDIEALLAGIADDAVWEYPGHSALSGRFEGKEAIRKQWERWFEGVGHVAFTLDHVAVESIFALGPSNTVMVEWRAEVEDAHGTQYDAAGVTVIEVHKGKTTRITEYFYDVEGLVAFWGPEEANATA